MSWKPIERFGSRLAVIGGIVLTLTGSSLYMGGKKVILVIRETIQLKDVMDSLKTEYQIHWDVSESLHEDILALKEQQKLDFYFHRENSRKHDNNDYYTVFDDGVVVNIDLRDVPEGRDPWAFIMDGTYRKYPARWSEADRKYVILPEDREEYLIYEK